MQQLFLYTDLLINFRGDFRKINLKSFDCMLFYFYPYYK